MAYKRYFYSGKLVFITIVTFNRIPILVKNIELVREALKSVKYKFDIVAGVVMPDHMHFIIAPENINETSLIISFFKQYFTKNYISSVGLDPRIQNIQSSSRISKKEKNVWQRRFYDHIIRDEQDFNKHIDYIHYNPMKHLCVAPKDWEFSSFKKFVDNGFYENDWCNFGDKNNIEKMNLE